MAGSSGTTQQKATGHEAERLRARVPVRERDDATWPEKGGLVGDNCSLTSGGKSLGVPRKKKRAGRTNISSVSLERELADEAKRVARNLGMSFSGLIRQLLQEQIMADADLSVRRERKENDSWRSQCRQRERDILLLMQRIGELPPVRKKVLALYYHESLQPAEIAACLGLTECEIEQIRAETVGLLRTMLAGQMSLPEVPASFDKPHDADGADVLVNG